jgi:PEP-CTERM/exosortase A-associated glycosyltransferase
MRSAGRRLLRDPRGLVAATWPAVREGKLRVLLRLSGALHPAMRSRAWTAAGGVSCAAARLRPAQSAPGLVAVLAAWETGRRSDAVAAVERGIATGTPGRRLALARFCLAIDRPDLALRLLERASGERAEAARLRALALRQQGHLGEALHVAVGASARRPRSGRFRRTTQMIAGERRVRSGWRPAVALQPAGAAVRGRILHLVTESLPYYQSGYTIRTHEIVLAQRAAGLDPSVVTSAGFPQTHGFLDPPPRDLVEGASYHRVPGGVWLPEDHRLQQYADGVAALTRELRPAVLHAASKFPNALVAAAVRDATGLPVVYEVRGFLEESWLARHAGQGPVGERYELDRAAETAAMRAADAVVTLGEGMKAEIAGRGIPADRITVVPNGVAPERFPPQPRDEALARRLGLAPGDVVLGYVSTFFAFEGIRHLVDATAVLRRRGRAVRLLLVGDGEERMALERQAHDLAVHDRVVFTGRVPRDQVNRYYALIDVFVVPRIDATVCHLVTPLKPLEAMAAERAVVVSDVRALREIVTEGETGFSFPAGDAEALADTVDTLLDDPARRAALGKAAGEWVRAERTWRSNGRRYRRLYERLGAV